LQKKLSRFLLSFILYFIVLTALFFSFGLNFGSKTKQAGVASRVTVFEQSDSITVLLIITDNQKLAHTFMTIQLDAPAQKITVTDIPKDKSIVYLNKTASLLSVYEYGSIKAVQNALEESENIKTDRYVRITDKAFVNIIDALDGVTVNVLQNINFSSEDFSLNIYKGNQHLMGSQLLLYIKYNEIHGLDTDKASILSSLINQNISRVKRPSATLFTSLINQADTNIGISDKDKYKPLLTEIANTADGYID